MEGDIGADLLGQPTAHVPDVGLAVVECRDDEIDDLQPDLAPAYCPDGVKHRLEITPDILLVEILTERLEVNLDGVDHLEELLGGVRLDVSGRHHAIFKSLLPGLER